MDPVPGGKQALEERLAKEPDRRADGDGVDQDGEAGPPCGEIVSGDIEEAVCEVEERQGENDGGEICSGHDEGVLLWYRIDLPLGVNRMDDKIVDANLEDDRYIYSECINYSKWSSLVSMYNIDC